MSENQKKPRAMTEKRFATAKLSGKTTAEGFLAAHMMFLRNHTFLDPILDAYDNGDIQPTPTLQAVQSALMTHVLESEIAAQEAKLAERQEKKSKGRRKSSDPNVDESDVPGKAYTVTLMVKGNDDQGVEIIQVGTIEEITGYKIRTPKGDIVVETKEEASGFPILEKYTETYPAEWDADTFQQAMGVADRRLFQRADSVYATIRNNYDRPIITEVQRGDAIARILKGKKGAVSRVRGRSTKTLGFQPHAKQTRVTGPWSR